MLMVVDCGNGYSGDGGIGDHGGDNIDNDEENSFL